MKTYDVQSGTLRSVVRAESSRQAALWAVHQAMQQVFPIEGEQVAPSIKSEQIQNDGVAVLAAKVTVCEHGGGCQQVTTLPTLEVVSQWNELVTTLDRLERMLYRAA